MSEETGTEGGVYVGDVDIVCEKCNESIPIGIFAFAADADNGLMDIWAEPDVSEAWSHKWVCENEG